MMMNHDHAAETGRARARPRAATRALPIALGLAVGVAGMMTVAPVSPEPALAAEHGCVVQRKVELAAKDPEAAKGLELTSEEMQAAYDCVVEELKARYAKSDIAAAKTYASWPKFNKTPYQSGTHGGRYVNNFSNEAGKAGYATFEEVGAMPVGSVLAKDSFAVGKDGKVGFGPLFLMTKKEAGFDPDNGDWEYAIILPNGKVMGITKGPGGDKIGFCAECHNGAADQDYLFFLPEELRTTSN